MKNSSRGSPIRSTSSRVTSTPLKGITTSRIRPSPAAALGVAGPVHHAGASRAAGSGRPAAPGRPRRRRAVPRSRARRGRAALQESGSGRPSSSISQTRSAPRSTASPQPLVEAARAAAVVVQGDARPGRGRSPVASRQPLPRAVRGRVVDHDDLRQPGRPRAAAPPVVCSSGSRLKVTTTAAMRGWGPSFTQDTLRTGTRTTWATVLPRCGGFSEAQAARRPSTSSNGPWLRCERSEPRNPGTDARWCGHRPGWVPPTPRGDRTVGGSSPGR